MPNPKKIGFLGATDPTAWSKYVAAFANKLRTLGDIGGQPVAVSYKWAGGNTAAYKTITQQFVADGVDAIVTSGTEPVIEASKAAPNKVIFYATAGEQFQGNPNIIGTWNEQSHRDHSNNRFGFLNRIFGQGKTIAVMGNFGLNNSKAERGHIVGPGGVGQGNGLTVIDVDLLHDPSQFAAKVTALPANVALLYVCTDPTITANQGTIIAAANNRNLPTMFAFREYVENGALLSFGPDFKEMFETAATKVHSFLSGTPLHKIHSSTAVAHKLVLNTITETAIHVTIPPGVRAQAELWP